jgi:geranylgeranyl diphosphate synthase type II
MLSFKETAELFSENFKTGSFPKEPSSLYEPADYFLQLGGKRIRPVLCLMGNELFDEINPDALHAAAAIELFHNFTLIHDDVMDKAPLRRGMMTVHEKYGDNTALLSGDVMMISAYEHLSKIDKMLLPKLLSMFNKTAKAVCEGQQYDMDFEKKETVTLDEYIRMIELKTSVLLAASLEMGATIGGASLGNRQHLYEFGKNLGIAFQVQDDYLDAFGDPGKFGKDVGGDIRQNKKTFLLIHALNTCDDTNRRELNRLMADNPEDKVEKVLSIFKSCNVDDWAKTLKQTYIQKAHEHLDAIAVVSARKKPLAELAEFLVSREN